LLALATLGIKTVVEWKTQRNYDLAQRTGAVADSTF
jgi:hypothetical protein